MLTVLLRSLDLKFGRTDIVHAVGIEITRRTHLFRGRPSRSVSQIEWVRTHSHTRNLAKVWSLIPFRKERYSLRRGPASLIKSKLP